MHILSLFYNPLINYGMMESTHGAANPFASATEPPDEAEPTAADVFFDTLPADSSAPHAADPAEESAYVSFTVRLRR